MADSDETVELLFFDTFSHDINEDLNLDLVQFPQPVYIAEVRIIPLGARVQADFPGGVRLGATNPSKFHIQLFVNDLSKPGASTFERLGDFEYNQNDCINYDAKNCNNATGERIRQIPTDGLVLRGSYTTITLAVYGSLASDEIREQQISSPPPPSVPIEEISNSLGNEENAEPTPAIDFSSPIVADSKETAQKFFANETNPEKIIKSNVSVSESARQYTEDWVASTGNVVPIIPSSVDAKSPDIDNWNADDDLNKATAIISSPRSGRRSRSPDARRLKRDWSKSPEYRRHRPYERSVLDKKLQKSREYEASRRSPPSISNRVPRTPSPEHIQSPSDARRTPESHLSDDFHKYPKVVLSPQSATEDNEKAITAISSLAPTEAEDDAMSQGEPFEPILSDDEIPDDATEQYEMDYDDAENTVYSALKHFNPFTEEIKHYVSADEKMSANARELVELATKCLHRSKLKESASIEKTFVESQSNEMRENWVHAAEQLIQIINLIYNLAGATQTRSQQTLNNLVLLNRQQLVDWMRIGLNFDCANSQQQPGYKIRHMKCGLRLVEMLAVDETFIECLIFKEKFNVFEYLYRLYEQKFMALSLKLMICRAIFACLDTKTGIEFFTRLNSNDEVKPISAENGYQKLIKLLQENPLTRIKFPLKAILKKVNLYESLQVIRDIMKRRFVNSDIKLEVNDDVVDEAPDGKLLKDCLKEVWSAFTWDAQSYSQPKRFLPISTKFEKVLDMNANKMASNSFIRYFRINGLIESLLMIISQSTNHDIISEDVFDMTLLILESLCSTECGLNYLSEKSEVTNVLIKCLIQAPLDGQPDDVDMTELDSIANNTLDVTGDIDEDSRRYHLGIEIAYKIKTKFYLDSIADLPLNCEKRDELLPEYFHGLYSLAVADNYIGRGYVIETITMSGNIITILKQIEYEKKKINAVASKNATASDASKTTADNSMLKKSPTLGYAIDLIDLTIRYATTNLDYLRQHGSVLVNLAKSHDQFDDASISQILQEMAIFLKPLQLQNIFCYDNIASLCDIIKRSIEFITTFPGDLIMALRIIRYLSIPDTSIFNDGTDFADTFGDAGATNKFKQPNEQHQVELKYKFVILQFYSADGISTCIQILDKLTTFFTQPAVHIATLGSTQGQMLTQILLPTIEILRKMLSYVIDCRNTEFKDLTAIEPLLKTYTLVSSIPAQSIAADDAQAIQTEIVKTLLAYTQPTPTDGVDTESVQKSLWTQMLGELCKYIMSGPYTIVSGLSLFSQLLPVPLPILTKNPLTNDEQARLITDRQLWSAHLHPQSIELSAMIQALCISSYAPLIDILSRVIGQLSDLAPNMALLVTKAIVDSLLNDGSSSIQATTNTQNGSTATTPLNTTVASTSSSTTTATAISATQTQTQLILAYINPSTKRILGFLTNILCYAPVKVAFLSMIHGKVFELLTKVLAVKSTSIPSNLLSILNQEQESVLMIFHTILNGDISLVGQTEYGVSNSKMLSSPSVDLIVGCSIPSKDCYIGVLSAVLDWFFNVDDSLNTTGCQFAAMKTMTLATNYDFTSYQLKILLDKRKDQLLLKLRSLTQLADGDQIAHEILLAFLQFILSLARSSDIVKNEQRSFACNESDLVKLFQFKRIASDVDVPNENQHPLLALEQSVQKIQAKLEQSDDVKMHLDEILFNLRKLLNILDSGLAIVANATKELLHVDSPAAEPSFPQGESIVVQYSMRPIFNVAPSEFKPSDYPEQLTTQYWYSHWSANRFDEMIDTQLPAVDNVPCDFIELIKSCLPPETNLTNDCKRLLHLSASPQSNRERTTSAPCFRTRRVEVEPSTGRPEKKLYISRGRGFPRPTQSRGDLFRSRPPNTSRPPSLHVDDFLALETCGAQPTGPTGYNKLSREMISIRGTRGGRGRGRILSSSPSYRHTSLRRTNSPSTWANHSMGNSNQHDSSTSSTASQHFRTATSEPVSSHFQSDYFGSRGRRGSLRPPRSFSKFN
ncbi:protein virilizer [Contarinia nasturtii]|uniref:protein virilizer n=1 Tax=Contarinia nasturtii TaxID=265458 RepID=UPI0012D3CA48|nr:protein virilizer [Contarinia nasturtii]